jgi:hypothetical protein
LYFEESTKYAGLLKVPGLCKLLDGFKVKLKAFLVPSKSDLTTKDTKGKKSKENDVGEYSTRILVYGLISEKDAVGNLLSEADLHLQHPQVMEYDTSVEYSNPHYLVRPGGQMPKIEDLSLDSDTQEEKQPVGLSEITKGRLLRILDSADGLGASAKVVTSPRLRSDLMKYVDSLRPFNSLLTMYSHQRIALAMMVEKECGVIEYPDFPSLWVKTSDCEMKSE